MLNLSQCSHHPPTRRDERGQRRRERSREPGKQGSLGLPGEAPPVWPGGGEAHRSLSALEPAGQERGGLQSLCVRPEPSLSCHLPETRTGAETDRRTRISVHTPVVVTMTLKGGQSWVSHRILSTTRNKPASDRLHLFLTVAFLSA